MNAKQFSTAPAGKGGYTADLAMRVRPEVKEEVVRLAKRYGVSASAVARVVVDAGLQAMKLCDDNRAGQGA